MDTKKDTIELDLAEIFKRYEKDHGPIKESDIEDFYFGKAKGKEVW